MGLKSIFNHISVYDTQNEKWDKEEPANTPPPARFGHKAMVRNNKMYLFYGRGVNGSLDDIWEYDPEEQTFTWIVPASAANPPARYDHSISTIGDKTYMFGGVDNTWMPLNDLWAYSWTVNKWEPMPPLPGTPLYGHVSFTDGTNLLIVSSFGNLSGTQDVFVFSPETNSWSTHIASGITKPLMNASAFQWNDQTGLMLTGSAYGNCEGACYKMNVDPYTFQPLSPGPMIEGAALTSVPGSYQFKTGTTNYAEFLLFGGKNGNNFSNETWIYTSDIESTSGIEEILLAEIKLFPNPVTDILNIMIDYPDINPTTCRFQISGLIGNKVMDRPISSRNVTLSICDLPSGIYILELFLDQRSYKEKLFIK